MKIGQYCQRQRCRHVELEQFWQAFASRGFVSDSWAFLFRSIYDVVHGGESDRCIRRSKMSRHGWTAVSGRLSSESIIRGNARRVTSYEECAGIMPHCVTCRGWFTASDRTLCLQLRYFHLFNENKPVFIKQARSGAVYRRTPDACFKPPE